MACKDSASTAGVWEAPPSTILNNDNSFVVGKYPGSSSDATLTSASMVVGVDSSKSGKYWRLRLTSSTGAWQSSKVAMFYSSDCSGGTLSTPTDTFSTGVNNGGIANVMDGDDETYVQVSSDATPGTLGFEWDTAVSLGSIHLTAPVSDGALSIAVETSDGQAYETAVVFDDLAKSRFQEGECFSVLRKGSDLVTVEKVALIAVDANANDPGCTQFDLQYATEKRPHLAAITCPTNALWCDGDLSTKHVVAETTKTAYEAGPNVLEIAFDAPSSVESLQTFVRYGDTDETGYEGVTIVAHTAAGPVSPAVYTRSTLWGANSKTSELDVDGGFGYSSWNTHRFDKVDDVTKLVVTFGWAKQSDKYGYSVEEIRVVVASAEAPVWTTAATVKVNEKAITLGPEVPFAAKWRLQSFTSADPNYCVAHVQIVGRDVGTMLDDCASEFCPAAHPDGSPGHAEGAVYDCVAGCEISAMGWTSSLSFSGTSTCSAGVQNQAACKGGYDYFTEQNNIFEPLNFESKSRYNVVVEAVDNEGGVVTQIMEISLLDNYESPILPNTRRSISENSLRGTMVGVPILASDVDSAKEVTFEILQQRKLDRESGLWGLIETNDAFAVGPTNGQVTVKNVHIDYETSGTYELTVSAVDTGNKASSAVVYVDVIDVNEVPVLPQQPNTGCPGGWIAFTDDTPFCCLRQEGANDTVHCRGPATKWDEAGKHRAICGLNKGATNQWPLCDDMKSTFVVDSDTGGLVPGGVVKENSPVDTVVGVLGADPEDIVGRNVNYAIIGGDSYGEFKLNRVIHLIDASVVQIQVARQTINWERPIREYL